MAHITSKSVMIWHQSVGKHILWDLVSETSSISLSGVIISLLHVDEKKMERKKNNVYVFVNIN